VFFFRVRGRKLPENHGLGGKNWVWIGLTWYLMGLSDIIGIEWDCFVKNLGDGDGG
jgi:hypothetical protein